MIVLGTGHVLVIWSDQYTGQYRCTMCRYTSMYRCFGEKEKGGEKEGMVEEEEGRRKEAEEERRREEEEEETRKTYVHDGGV